MLGVKEFTRAGIYGDDICCDESQWQNFMVFHQPV